MWQGFHVKNRDWENQFLKSTPGFLIFFEILKLLKLINTFKPKFER